MQTESFTQTVVISKTSSAEDEEQRHRKSRSESDIRLKHNRSQSIGLLSNSEVMADVKKHKRNASLRQRFENAEQMVHKFVAEAEQMAEQAVVKLCTEAWNVCHFTQLPKWLQDNEFLHRGHRPPLPSLRICFKSVFRLHSETGNIWTHGLGALIFVFLFVYSMLTLNDYHSWVDRLMIGTYFCGAITCLSFSAMFHTCCCHSREVSKFCSKLDYCGISIQITGSMIPALYYGFYYDWPIYVTYISAGLVLCAISVIFCLWDRFGEPKYRTLRTLVFLAYGLSGVVPGIHWCIVLESHLIRSFLLLFVLQGLLYVIGALLYAIRIPERFFPGKCDYWFQSHQIFHILVVLAAFVHLNGINFAAELRLTESLNLEPIHI